MEKQIWFEKSQRKSQWGGMFVYFKKGGEKYVSITQVLNYP